MTNRSGAAILSLVMRLIRLAAGDPVPAKVGDVDVTFVRANGRRFFHVPATIVSK